MNTVIGKDTVFTGTIDIKGGIRIDGTVKGKVLSNDTVTVGSTGMVEADVEANAAVVAGKVVGNLNARESVELQANSDVEGDIRTKSLVVEQGAIFCGGCHMKNGKSAAKFLPPEEDRQLNIGKQEQEKEKETEQAKK